MKCKLKDKEKFK
jgi:hypothetical protein